MVGCMKGLQRVVLESGMVGYRSPLLDEREVPHWFTTRVGPAGRELDVGRLSAAEEQLLLEAVGVRGAELVGARQVHGAGVLRVEEHEVGAQEREADALVSSRPDRCLLVRSADCVPILIASEDGARVAAVHAGWRGLVAGVIPRALEALGAGPKVAAIGACISLAHFEVGPEVVRAFEAAELGGSIEERPGERAHIDVRAAAAMQLERGGVERIDLCGACTFRSAEELYSYRRDVTRGGARRTGSLGAFVAARPRTKGT